MDKLTLLQQVDVFASLDAASSQRLMDNADLVRFEDGAHIIAKGERGAEMYVIAEGEVQVPIEDRRGQLKFFAQYGPGQFFGEMALLMDGPRTADVYAVSDCTLLKIDKATLEALMQAHPEVARLLTNILGKRLLNSDAIVQVGKYKLLDELGRGGMSTVYEGFHPDLQRCVAVKMLSHELLYRPEFVERFQREARTIARLRHPNIIAVYDFEEAYATSFIIMEKLEGETLHDVLQGSGPLAPADCQYVLQELAKALAFAHESGVVHRDIKPANIAVDNGRIKLMDFGLAMTSQNVGVGSWGSFHYMAPEHIAGQSGDARVDIYALGILAFELLTGQPPFVGEVEAVLQQHLHAPLPALRDLVPDMPQVLADFVERATAKEPERRYCDCTEVLRHLQSDAAERGIATSRVAIEQLALRQWLLVAPAGQEEALDELRAKTRAWLRDHPEIQLLESTPEG